MQHIDTLIVAQQGRNESKSVYMYNEAQMPTISTTTQTTLADQG